jgi:hypothetical protein
VPLSILIHYQPDLAAEGHTCALVSVDDMVLDINWSYPKLADDIKYSPSHTLAWRTLHSWAKTLLPFQCNTMKCELTDWRLKALATGVKVRSIGRNLVHVRHSQYEDGIHESNGSRIQFAMDCDYVQTYGGADLETETGQSGTAAYEENRHGA